jgi:hypothetical protein
LAQAAVAKALLRDRNNWRPTNPCGLLRRLEGEPKVPRYAARRQGFVASWSLDASWAEELLTRVFRRTLVDDCPFQRLVIPFLDQIASVARIASLGCPVALGSVPDDAGAVLVLGVVLFWGCGCNQGYGRCGHALALDAGFIALEGREIGGARDYPDGGQRVTRAVAL